MYWPPLFALFIGLVLLILPAFQPLHVFDLDKIEPWGLQGPSRDLDDMPMMGIYLFVGLNPPLLADLSYGHGLTTNDAGHKEFQFNFDGPGVLFVEGNLEHLQNHVGTRL